MEHTQGVSQNKTPSSLSAPIPATPLAVIAHVSRVVTLVIDRITGDRVEVPLLVATACMEALKQFKIDSRVMFGQVAWVEILEDQTPIWAGCWGENYHFWVATQFGEVVDLNTSVACRKRSHSNPGLKSVYSPPILWAKDVPGFYRYIPEGIAELDLLDTRDQKNFQLVMSEIKEKCNPSLLKEESEQDLSFPNEPILCPDRRVLDDSKTTFQYFERALGIQGIPKAPI